ncbi:MAG: TorF family putative porin [Pseudomonadota bacterium]
MRTLALSLISSISVLACGVPAFAQDEGPLTVTGSFALVSDYRFRGVSQTDEDMAVQGGLTLNHESGAYVGTWGSNLAGWGTFGGPNIELDLFAGYKHSLSETMAVDVGVTVYTYPGGADDTTFFEPYAKLSGAAGPASWLAGVAYAPKQTALGNYSNTPQSRGQKDDNLYLWGDVSGAIPNTPVTLKAHIGYSEGNPGLGPNGTSVAPTGEYLDWMVGADFALGPVVVGIAYVDTDISKSESAYLLPNFSNAKGGSIADGTVVLSLSAAF